MIWQQIRNAVSGGDAVLADKNAIISGEDENVIVNKYWCSVDKDAIVSDEADKNIVFLVEMKMRVINSKNIQLLISIFTPLFYS